MTDDAMPIRDVIFEQTMIVNVDDLHEFQPTIRPEHWPPSRGRDWRTIVPDDQIITPPPGGQPQALTDDELDGVIATLAVNCALGEEDAARLLATLDEARARAALLEALGREQQRLNEVMVASLQRGLEKLQASEALARDQQATNEAMVASLQRGLAQLEASEAEVARLRALLERSVEYFDYMEDRGYSSVRVLRSDVMAALAAVDMGRAPTGEHEPTCLLGKYAYAGCTCEPDGEAAGNG